MVVVAVVVVVVFVVVVVAVLVVVVVDVVVGVRLCLRPRAYGGSEIVGPNPSQSNSLSELRRT